MKHYSEMKIPTPCIYRDKKGREFDDNIYCFDIETISLFKINGKWRSFDYSKDSDYYRENEIQKACVPYIWQFGINDQVFYGREFMDFERVLKALSSKRTTKFIYVHNLSYEMQFLVDIFQANNWHISEMCARNIHAPIQFKIDELNIVFRCSYMLTNLSLEKSAIKYTNTTKAVGDLDYNKVHSPYSQLDDQEKYYCEQDIKTLYEIIKHFKEEYNNHIQTIPLTQTGEVRRALKKELDYFYFKKQWRLVPNEKIYVYLLSAFQGGITHANALYSNQIINNVWSYDINSSYPYSLMLKYPSEDFFRIREKDIDRYKDSHALLYHIKLTNVRSKLYNHYLSKHKVFDYVKGKYGCIDNGRICACESCRVICTDIDLEMIKLSYYADIEIISVFASFKRYLDRRVILFILNAYKNKTTLKNKAKEDDLINAFYMKEKQKINAMFGISCSSPLKHGIEYDSVTNEWNGHKIDDIVTDRNGNNVRFIDKVLEDMTHSYSTLLPYFCGVWCTSYSRRALWSNIAKLDSQVVYYDTDSIKGVGDIGTVIEDYNKTVIEQLKQCAKDNDIDLELYMPLDDKGNPRPLGVFEQEQTSDRFITLGAKKYCTEKTGKDGKKHLEITVSGVRKEAVSQLRSIEDFKKGLVFDYEHAKKLTHYYMDEQQPFTYTDCQSNKYHSTQRHSIVLQPTTYSLGITDDYERFIESVIGIIPDKY